MAEKPTACFTSDSTYYAQINEAAKPSNDVLYKQSKITLPPIYLPWIYGFLEASETPLLTECILEHFRGKQSQGPL